MDPVPISVVIPTYNGKKLLQKYLPSVVAACRKYSIKHTEIIIVDDASNDDTVKYLKLNFSKIKIIQHATNHGF